MTDREEGPLWYQRHRHHLLVLNILSHLAVMRWLCSRETDVHICPGIDRGRPSVSDVLKSLCQYRLIGTRRYLDFWDCFWELAHVWALGSGGISITRDRSRPLLVVLWFLVVHTWDLCARIFKKRLMVFEGLEWSCDEFNSRIFFCAERIDFLDIWHWSHDNIAEKFWFIKNNPCWLLESK